MSESDESGPPCTLPPMGILRAAMSRLDSEQESVSVVHVTDAEEEELEPRESHLKTMMAGGIAHGLLGLAWALLLRWGDRSLRASERVGGLDADTLGLLFSLSGNALSALIAAYGSIGIAQASLRLVHRDEVKLADFFPTQLPLIGNAVVAYGLWGVGMGVGTLLFVVPGLVFFVGTLLWPHAMLREGLRPADALRRSWQLTSEVRLSLGLYLLLATVGGGVIIALTCGTGVLWVMPVYSVANALIYERLRAHRPPR